MESAYTYVRVALADSRQPDLEHMRMVPTVSKITRLWQRARSDSLKPVTCRHSRDGTDG